MASAGGYMPPMCQRAARPQDRHITAGHVSDTINALVALRDTMCNNLVHLLATHGFVLGPRYKIGVMSTLDPWHMPLRVADVGRFAASGYIDANEDETLGQTVRRTTNGLVLALLRDIEAGLRALVVPPGVDLAVQNIVCVGAFIKDGHAMLGLIWAAPDDLPGSRTDARSCKTRTFFDTSSPAYCTPWL